MTTVHDDDRLDRVLADLTRVGPDPAFRARVLRRLNAGAASPRPAIPWSSWLPVRASGVAVALLIMATAGWLVSRGTGELDGPGGDRVAPNETAMPGALAGGATAQGGGPAQSAPAGMDPTSAPMATTTAAVQGPLSRSAAARRGQRRGDTEEELLPRPPAVAVETLAIEPLALAPVSEATDFAPLTPLEPVLVSPVHIEPVGREP